MTSPKPAARVGWSGLMPFIAAGIVVAGGIALGVGKPVLVDEAFTMDTVSGSMGRTFQQSLWFELQPPLYFMLLRAWLTLNHSVPFARLLSAVFAGLTVLVIHDLARRISRGRGGAARALVLAVLSTPVLWAAAEARTYALAILLAATSLDLFWRRWMSDVPAPQWCGAAWVAVSYAALLTNYYAGFVLLGQGVAALVAGRAGSMMKHVGILGLAMVPWVPVVLRQVAAHPATPPVGLGGLGQEFLLALNRPLFWGSIFDRGWFVAAGAAMVVGMAAVCWFRAGPEERGHRWTWQLALVPLGVLFALQATGATNVEARHWLVATPAAVVALAVAPDVLGHSRARLLAFAAPMVLSTAALVSMVRNQVGSADGEVGRYLETHVAPNEPVLVLPPDYILRLRHVAQDADRFRGLPADVSVAVFPFPDSTRSPRSPCTVIRRIAEVGGDSARVWIVALPLTYSARATLDTALAALPHQVTAFEGIRVVRIDFRAATGDSLVASFCRP